MAAILDLVNFHRYKDLEKNAIPFFLITTMFQMGINKKITFNKHFARKYIRAYTKGLLQGSSLKKLVSGGSFIREKSTKEELKG